MAETETVNLGSSAEAPANGQTLSVQTLPPWLLAAINMALALFGPMIFGKLASMLVQHGYKVTDPSGNVVTM